MASCRYNCDEIGEYENTLDNCSIYRAGGSSNLYILECDHEITDPTSQAQIDAAVAAGQATLVQNVKSGFAAGSPITVAPVTSCGSDVVVNNEVTGTIYDSKVTELNTAFWLTWTGGRVAGGIIMGVCPTDGLEDMLIYIDAEITFSGGLVLPDTSADVIRYEINFTFRKKQIETLADTEGIFS